MSKEKNNTCPQRKTSIGGQALLEGIMMRGPKLTAMAVRDPDGNIVLETSETPAMGKSKIARLPIIRGVVNFIASMRVGYKYLMRSAEIAMPEELTDPKRSAEESKVEEIGDAILVTDSDEPAPEADPILTSAADGENANAEDPTTTKKKKEKEKKEEKKEGSNSLLMGTIMVVATVLGVVLAVGLFIMLPSFIYRWCANLMPFLEPEHPALRSLVKSVFEGVLKIAVLVGYMLVVRLMKDIKRTFQYHGAEHKTIFCYEHGKELTVENVRGERRFHPRCGTSFLILMLIVGIFISFFIDPVSILIFGAVPPTLLRAFIRLALLPLMMGVGYELIKLAGKHDNLFTRIISAPGMWLQRITVLEPDDGMIECALAAFKEVIPEKEQES